MKEDTGGAQPKIDVRDAAGRQWDVKFGEEVHAEIAPTGSSGRSATWPRSCTTCRTAPSPA